MARFWPIRMVLAGGLGKSDTARALGDDHTIVRMTHSILGKSGAARALGVFLSSNRSRCDGVFLDSNMRQNNNRLMIRNATSDIRNL